MQPLLYTSKAWQAIRAGGSLKKREPSKNKLSLVTEVKEPKTSSLVKPRRWNNFIVKFQYLKHGLLSSESTIRKLIWKIIQNWTTFKSNFFSRKNWNKSHQNFIVICCLQGEKINILLEWLLPYMHPIIYPKCIGSGIQTTVKLNKPLSVMTVCRHGFHNGVMAYMLQFG